MRKQKRLIVVVGPTGVGKTAVAVWLSHVFTDRCVPISVPDTARFLDEGVDDCRVPILSCDSRQFYREMSIGTAVPSQLELAAAPHHFIHNLSIKDSYNAGLFEEQAIALLGLLFQKHDTVIMVGGSGMYVDAVCRGFDELPVADAELRGGLAHLSIDELLVRLRELDLDYYGVVDHGNRHRVQRAVEVCVSSGQRYSSLRTAKVKERDFEIIKVGITMPRAELYARIDRRVDGMMEQGLVREVQNLYPWRELSALQTVGYRELFEYMDGAIDLNTAVELIKRNSRRYAKRQLTWFMRDEQTRWFAPDQLEEMVCYIGQQS